MGKFPETFVIRPSACHPGAGWSPLHSPWHSGQMPAAPRSLKNGLLQPQSKWAWVCPLRMTLSTSLPLPRPSAQFPPQGMSVTQLQAAQRNLCSLRESSPHGAPVRGQSHRTDMAPCCAPCATPYLQSSSHPIFLIYLILVTPLCEEGSWTLSPFQG